MKFLPESTRAFGILTGRDPAFFQRLPVSALTRRQRQQYRVGEYATKPEDFDTTHPELKENEFIANTHPVTGEEAVIDVVAKEIPQEPQQEIQPDVVREATPQST